MSNDTIIDTQFGLNQLSGNETLLITLLTKFADEYAEAEQKIENLIAQENWEEARVYLHTLKGVSGNLGCNRLLEQARLAEHFMMSNQSTPPNLSSTLSALTATLATIDSIKTAGSIAASSNVPSSSLSDTDNAAELSQVSSGLITALENHEFIPQEQLEPWLSEVTDDIREQVREAIDELDYELAIQLLKN